MDDINGAALECSKCHGKMEPGYMLDRTHGGYDAGKWVEGRPEKSFWTGIKISDRQQLAVLTYRCMACGYLESYAK